MGIFAQIAVPLLREHRHKPITGNILCIGRQTVFLSPENAVALVKHELGTIHRREAIFEIDTTTRASSRGRFISDRGFFSLFSEAQYHCLDVSDYEGADLVADLCQPLPPLLDGQFDFIVEGSTLDNVFDPATAIRNLARLLRPGGRILHANHAARRHNTYVGFSLSWFHDYYAINQFDDCQVYLAQWDGDRDAARWDFYHYQPVRTEGGLTTFFGQDRYYHPWREAMAVVIAEKGADSTHDRCPVQYEYRPSTPWESRDGRHETLHQRLSEDRDDPYFAAAMRFQSGTRAPLFSSAEKVKLPDELLLYSPETPYRGSLFPIDRHLRGISRPSSIPGEEGDARDPIL